MKNSTRITSNFLLVFTFIFSSFFFCSLVKAQTVSDTLNSSTEFYNYNQNSVYENHISYQKTVWRRSYLREKQNQPFFVKGNEITKVIIDAVLLGKLKPYGNYSLKKEMSEDEFSENLTIPHSEGCVLSEEIPLLLDGEWANSSTFQDFEEEDTTDIYLQFQPTQICILETKSDLFFDTRRNQMINKIISIDLIIPASMNESTGLDKTLASFSYQQFIKYLFEENNFVGNNPRNSRANLNPKEAFDLMLLSGILIQSFDNDSYLFYGIDSKEELQKAHLYYNKLIEYESNFWENGKINLFFQNLQKSTQ